MGRCYQDQSAWCRLCFAGGDAVFRAQHYGKIINISGGGAANPMPAITAYAASKAGVVRFTESLALECKNDRIDVNAIAPGALVTHMMEHFSKPDRRRSDRNFSTE